MNKKELELKLVSIENKISTLQKEKEILICDTAKYSINQKFIWGNDYDIRVIQDICYDSEEKDICYIFDNGIFMGTVSYLEKEIDALLKKGDITINE